MARTCRTVVATGLTCWAVCVCATQILTKLTTLCLLFADQVQRLMASLESSKASFGELCLLCHQLCAPVV